MGTQNICLYKEVDKQYTGCNLKTTESLDCALIGVCAVIRSNTVSSLLLNYSKLTRGIIMGCLKIESLIKIHSISYKKPYLDIEGHAQTELHYCL